MNDSHRTVNKFRIQTYKNIKQIHTSLFLPLFVNYVCQNSAVYANNKTVDP